EVPSLLLHNLGTIKHDSEMDRRIAAIFQERHTYLCNVSGSGKTRLLLEGLCLHWGLYFTCLRDPLSIGSDDLPRKLSDITNDPFFEPAISAAQDAPSALGRNTAAVQQHIYAVLLSRLLILRRYISVLPKRDLTEDEQKSYRRRWLRLQVDPALFKGRHDLSSDIFVDLSNIIAEKSPSLGYLASYVSKTVQSLIPSRVSASACAPSIIPTLYVVIDEAQSASSECSDAFRAGLEKGVNWSVPRPLLREVVLRFFKPLEHVRAFIIPTGTNVSQTQLVQAIESTLLKPNSHQSVRPTAGLDRPRAVIDFVHPYLPPTLAGSDTGLLLLERIYRWLHGRFRFVTYFIECLIHNLYQSPHSLLNQFIAKSTGYLPSDA
ncbi:hypothetical protein EV715DRAFT_162445, partial [Schizophyllum commune]